MQLGMVGLGRMGANMVRRLMRGGHECVVFGMVKQHQGWVQCTSEVGRGTRFDIYLPRHEQGELRSRPAIGNDSGSTIAAHGARAWRLLRWRV